MLAFSRPRLACREAAWLRLTQTMNAKRRLRIPITYFGNLCGLWLGQALFEHLSGMVFVPSIMRELHIGQIFPVGRALIAFLQSG